MLSVKYRPKPGSASMSARSTADLRVTPSVTSGTPSVNIREEVRLSASVSVMAPTWACDASAPPPGGRPAPVTVTRRSRPARSRALDHLVGPQVVGVAGRGGEVVAAAVVGAGEVLTGLPGPVVLLAA